MQHKLVRSVHLVLLRVNSMLGRASPVGIDCTRYRWLIEVDADYSQIERSVYQKDRPMFFPKSYQKVSKYN